MADELAKAITKIVHPALKTEGFRRARKRDLVRFENGIAQLIYCSVSRWGTREFCVSISANLVASNEFVSLQPGFHLTRDTDGGTLTLSSLTAEQAEASAEVVLGSIRAEALPWLEKTRTVAGFAEILANERWGSSHHLSFQRGVASALLDDEAAARRHLADAIQLYEADGRDWCLDYVEKATLLQQALSAGTAAHLLAAWEQANLKAHGVA